MTDAIGSINGKCCACGYCGDEETPCQKREDGCHCEHWWEGNDMSQKIQSLTDETHNLRADLAAALAQLADEKQKVANLEEYVLKGVAFRDDLQARVKELECQKKALQQVNEEIESRLCATREAIKRNVINAPDLQAGNMNEAYLASLELVRRKEALSSAYLSSAPCPHAKEAEITRKALDSAQAELRGANYLIASIERLFPNWKLFRDLDVWMTVFVAN